jgi:hypothetical protein
MEACKDGKGEREREREREREQNQQIWFNPSRFVFQNHDFYVSVNVNSVSDAAHTTSGCINLRV